MIFENQEKFQKKKAFAAIVHCSCFMFSGLGVKLTDYISSVSEIETLKVMLQHERIWWEGSHRRK